MTNQSPAEALQSEIWSKSLKYLDFVAHYKPETSEHYYMYRDAKARELALGVMELVTAYAATVEREARYDEVRKANGERRCGCHVCDYIGDRLAALQGPREETDEPATRTD